MDMLAVAEPMFRVLESLVPPPQWVPWRGSQNFRYVEQLPGQALIQKAARQISGLRAVDVLAQARLLQEAGTILRTLDEIEQDIQFIAIGLARGELNEHHQRYLAHFWAEDPEPGHGPVQRKTIRSYINRAFPEQQTNPSRADEVGRTLYQAFSDYAHARSSALMAMVEGMPPRFCLSGVETEGARHWLAEQAPSYFYRAMVALALIAKAIAPEEVNASAYAAVQDAEQKYAPLLFP